MFLRIASYRFPFFYNCLTLAQTSNLERDGEGQRELQLHIRIGPQLFWKCDYISKLNVI
jgi:hypothetical protein